VRARSMSATSRPAALEEVRQKPGILDALEPDHPGMHTTDSIDFDVVVFGEVVLLVCSFSKEGEQEDVSLCPKSIA
jgi:hypothetical protein